ncbi:MAG TPA: succinylglutamate desuccinylase/aspartoacylase family protein [bacterium]|nr:succinylglutamate desuccinylase/aspartoacylase family protein [bacterium]
MQPLTVGTATASPGETARGVIVAGRDFDGPIEIPVVVVRGAADGPVLWVDGATHGDEPEGSIACWSLAKGIEAKRLAGTLVLVPIVNVAAAKNGSRGDPLDHVNYDLNRLYPGKPNGRGTERLAWAYHQEFASKADVVISLHSGGSMGYLSRVIYYNNIPASLELAKAFGPGWDLIVEPAYSADRRPATGTIEAVCEAKGKPALVVELGGLSESLPDKLLRNSRCLADGCLNIMRYLKMLSGTVERNGRWKLGREWIVQASTGGFWLPDATCTVRSPVRGGTVLARIVDVYGETLEEIKAPCDGETIGLRTNPYVALPGDHCVFFAEILREVSE